MEPRKALFRAGKWICRIYSVGWDSNIEAWREETEEHFEDICKHFNDDPAACKLVGEVKWVWLRFTPGGRAIIRQIDDQGEFRGESQVTMIRVHRVRTRLVASPKNQGKGT